MSEDCALSLTGCAAVTLRMWVIGLFLCVIASAMNVFFNFRSPAPTVIPLVLLCVLRCGGLPPLTSALLACFRTLRASSRPTRSPS